ncbi:hypothetical protein [Ponticaulis koreensis]|uniref:hypothetical protein n=1 Tax=Ponticaulis koreensis TaxID=1123045 RepID=UPI0003B761A5|nr:hypothetical protein [Ponticaulis koreensis]
MFKQSLTAIAAVLAVSAVPVTASAQSFLESTGLGDIDPWGVGTISRADGALPLTMWEGSTTEDLLPLFARLNPRGLTPTMNTFLRRVLLSPSRAPEGAGADQLLAQRMRLIWSLGELEAYEEIARQLPDADGILSAREARIEMQFLRGNLASACSNVRASTEANAYLYAARAGCFALEGNYSSANLALELAAELGTPDPWITTAIGAMQTMPAEPTERDIERLPAASFASGLTTALSLAGNFPVRDESFQGLNPGFAREISGRNDISRALRIQMADVATFAGLMTTQERSSAYRLEPVPAPPLPVAGEAPAETEETDAPDINAPVNALDEALQLAADRGTEEADLVVAIRRALAQSGSNTVHFSENARLLLPVMTRLRDLDALDQNGEYFAIAAFAAGDQRQATRFQRVSEIEGGPEPDLFLKAWVDGLRVLSGTDRSPASARLASTQLAQAASGDGQTAAAAELLYSLLMVDGVLSHEARDFLSGSAGDTLSEGDQLDIQTQILLTSGLRGGSTGEGLLRLVSALGRRPDTYAPEDIVDVIELLRATGYTTEARALAVEALGFHQIRN